MAASIQEIREHRFSLERELRNIHEQTPVNGWTKDVQAKVDALNDKIFMTRDQEISYQRTLDMEAARSDATVQMAAKKTFLLMRRTISLNLKKVSSMPGSGVVYSP